MCVLQTEVEGKNVPTPVRALAGHLVVAVAMGQYHTAVIVEAGHVYMFGRNSEGQLGTGNVKVTHAPIKLKLLADKTITVRVILMPCYLCAVFASKSKHGLTRIYNSLFMA